jgi:hypothetical protein
MMWGSVAAADPRTRRARLTYFGRDAERVVEAAEPREPAVRALGVRDFRRRAGTWASYILFFMTSVVQSVVAFELTGRNRAVGTVVFAQGAAMLVRACRRRRGRSLAEAEGACAHAVRRRRDLRHARRPARGGPPHAGALRRRPGARHRDLLSPRAPRLRGRAVPPACAATR